MLDFISKPGLKSQNVSHAYVDDVETALDIQFPEPLRIWYTEHNTAELKELPFLIGDIKEEFCLDCILPMKYGTWAVERSAKFDHDADNTVIPEHWYRFADDVSNDSFFWDSRDGAVYYLAMENYENPIPICESIDTLFKILNLAAKKNSEKPFVVSSEMTPRMNKIQENRKKRFRKRPYGKYQR